MSDFIFRITPNIMLGSYTVSRLGQQVLEFGSRFMVIMDPILHEMKTAEKILESLNSRKIENFVFSEISDGATTKTIQRALTLAKEGHIHGIIAAGGTKAISIAKCIAAVFNEVHDLYTFVDGAVPSTAALPCICVPTTYRTPFVFTNEIPVTDSRCNQMKIMKVQNNICRLLLTDPNLMLTLTENQKSTMTMEILNMAVESYLSRKATFFSDTFAEKGVELLSYVTNGSPSLDITTPPEILLAEAGCMISLSVASSSAGLNSLLAMAINSRYRISKPLVASILLPYMIDDAAKYKCARIEKIASIMHCIPEGQSGEEAVKSFSDMIRQKIAAGNLPARLKDIQLSIEQLSLAVEDAGQTETVTSLPRSMSTDDIFEFVKSAY